MRIRVSAIPRPAPSREADEAFTRLREDMLIGRGTHEPQALVTRAHYSGTNLVPFAVNPTKQVYTQSEQ